MGVRSLHRAFAIGAAMRALRRSAGTLSLDSFPARFRIHVYINYLFQGMVKLYPLTFVGHLLQEILPGFL